MASENFKILLADDDEDDCLFFKDALEELSIPASLSTVNNGDQLMNFLTSQSTTNLPDVLFLDLNMPKKTGLECLSQIKENKKLKEIPVIIYSTSSNHEVIDILYEKGANYYIRKPADFKNLKSVINKALILSSQNILIRSSKEEFLIQP